MATSSTRSLIRGIRSMPLNPSRVISRMITSGLSVFNFFNAVGASFASPITSILSFFFYAELTPCLITGWSSMIKTEIVAIVGAPLTGRFSDYIIR